MPKKISEVAMIIRCREIEPSLKGTAVFPIAIVEDASLGFLVTTNHAERCCFANAVTAMTQTAVTGDIIVCRSGSYFVSEQEGDLAPGVMTEQGFIIRPIHGNRFYYRYLSWFGNGPGLRMLRKEIAAKTLMMPDYTDENEQRIDAAEKAVEDAEEALALAEQSHVEAKQAIDTFWGTITR